MRFKIKKVLQDPWAAVQSAGLDVPLLNSLFRKAEHC
jgi:hypothetical protein